MNTSSAYISMGVCRCRAGLLTSALCEFLSSEFIYGDLTLSFAVCVHDIHIQQLPQFLQVFRDRLIFTDDQCKQLPIF